MEQTAVEWLENKCSEFETIYDSLPLRLYEYIQQAKEIEKQQIIDAANQDDFVFQRGFGMYDDVSAGQQYYNETFKNK